MYYAFLDVFDECLTLKGGCSFDCVWNYDTNSKICICPPHMYLLPDGKSCEQIPETSMNFRHFYALIRLKFFLILVRNHQFIKIVLSSKQSLIPSYLLKKSIIVYMSQWKRKITI